MVTRATLGGSTGFFFLRFFRSRGGFLGEVFDASFSPVSSVSSASAGGASVGASSASPGPGSPPEPAGSPSGSSPSDASGSLRKSGSGRSFTSGPNSNTPELFTNTPAGVPRSNAASRRDLTHRSAVKSVSGSDATRGYSHRPTTRSVSTRSPPTHSKASERSKSPAEGEAKRTTTIVAPPAGITQRVCVSISPSPSPSPSPAASSPASPSGSGGSFASSVTCAAGVSEGATPSASSPSASSPSAPPGRLGCTEGVRIWNDVTGSRSGRAARVATTSTSSSGGIQSGGLGGSGAPAATAASSSASASAGNAPASTVAVRACWLDAVLDPSRGSSVSRSALCAAASSARS